MIELDLALLALRAWVGYVMLRHGIHHATSLSGTASWFASKGFRAPALQARLSAVGESAVGVALVAGLLTPFAAAGVVATMTLAFWSVHRFAGFFVFKRPDEGWEYVATLALCSLLPAVLGPGALSVDAALGTVVDGWVGGLVALAGLAIAVVHLALFYRRPAETG